MTVVNPSTAVSITSTPETFTADETFTGRIFASRTHGIGVSYDGAIDGSLDTPGNTFRISGAIAISNGTNGPRGDSITSDAAEGAGGFYTGSFYTNNTMATQGSLNNFWSQIQLNESTDVVPPAYAEGVAFFGSVNANRQGALAEGIETGVTISTGKQSRANAATFAITEPNTVGSYAAVVGAASEYSVTGSRVVNVVSTGAQGAGVGVFIHGGIQTAAIMTSLATPATTPTVAIYSGSPRSDTNNTPLFQLTSTTLSWGPGGTAATDTNLYRASHSMLQTDNPFTIGAAGQLVLASTGQAIVSSGYFDITRTATGSGMVRTFVTGDANPRWQITADGSQSWGPGSAATDTTLARTAAGRLQVTNTLDIPTQLNVGGGAVGTTQGGLLIVQNSGNSDTIAIFRTGAWGSVQLKANGASPGTCSLETTNSTPLALGSVGVQAINIDTSQNVIVGPGAKATPAELAATATTGMFYIPTVNGTPSGTPSSLPTGAAPMVIDRTGNKLWFYIGGTWKGVAVA